jgi:hypothetical protein
VACSNQGQFAASSSCSDCPLGQSSDYQATSCYDCPRGKHSPCLRAPCSSCEDCPVGQFAEFDASTECQLCAPGRSECHHAAWNCSISCDTAVATWTEECEPGVSPQLACDTRDSTAQRQQLNKVLLVAALVGAVVVILVLVKVCCCKKKTVAPAAVEEAAPTPTDFTATNPVAMQPAAADMSPMAPMDMSSSPMGVGAPAQVQPPLSQPADAAAITTLDDLLTKANLMEFKPALL